MAIVSPYEQYEMTKILSSSPLERVILLYRRSIGLLERSIEALDSNDLIGFSENIGKACKIIEYLLSVLDTERGGIVAENLAKLYDFSLFTLTSSNISKDREGILRVKNILTGLLESWEEIKRYG
jgi:flagellar protein FliS